MRKLILIGALLIPGGHAAAGPAPGVEPAAQLPAARSQAGPVTTSPLTGEPCQNSRIVHADGRSAPARGSKLAELPPGNVVLTVVQEVERCQVPVIVRYGVGGAGGDVAAPVPPAGTRKALPPRRL